MTDQPILLVPEIARRTGEHEETIRRKLRDGEIWGDKVAGGAWGATEQAVKHYIDVRDHERRMRKSGIVVGYGEGEEFDAEFAARVEKVHGRATADSLRKVQARHRLFEQIADEVRGDADLKRAFEKLDDDEVIERTAHEIAGRVRREERIRRRAAQILAADDEHHA